MTIQQNLYTILYSQHLASTTDRYETYVPNMVSWINSKKCRSILHTQISQPNYLIPNIRTHHGKKNKALSLAVISWLLTVWSWGIHLAFMAKKKQLYPDDLLPLDDYTTTCGFFLEDALRKQKETH